MSSVSTNNLIALADCNNFYASCERCFNPQLIGKAIVILSNNDGCVIARSAEAKKLGIKMGAPFFEIRHLTISGELLAYSSNFPLYGDLSARVMHLLKSHAQEIEIYSIDEAFFTLPKLNDIMQYCRSIREQVRQCTAIPISIGLAESKTLAKIATTQAKKSHDGVFLIDSSNREELLKNTPIEDIWGIGRRLSKKLQNYGINTAWQLAHSDDKFLLSHFGVCMLRSCHDLRAIPSISLETEKTAKQSIRVSRTFPQIINDITTLLQQLSFFTDRACQKLRREKQKALYIDVFLEGPYPKRKQLSMRYYLDEPSDYTPDFIRAAELVGQKLFDFSEIRKAGITLHHFSSQDSWQQEFFSQVRDHKKQTSLMHEVDQINLKFGTGSLTYLSSGKREFPRGTRLSPRYTTSWDQLPKVK
ncbi:Y-family DNA polymerase [Lentisphaera profundi]|uniref:Y-family DNA polymerase n=1 Tax=Lentisphaera profundi TaxID=1658616 RepID=A0ABY7VVH6_9BACT|nr:Y-family DNA polymerase [Lentisphaera profundi]WDE96744.1 Y-family DNA polymerase [Lentisphaera profundi]